MATLKLQADASDRVLDEKADLAAKTFELSQRLHEKWVTANAGEQQQMLNSLCLNLKLDGVSLVCEMRKPFGLLAEGLFLENNRGDKI